MRDLLDRYILKADRQLGLAPPAPPKQPTERTFNDEPAAQTERWYEQNHPQPYSPEWFSKAEREGGSRIAARTVGRRTRADAATRRHGRTRAG
jgi:hypothetical protein